MPGLTLKNRIRTVRLLQLACYLTVCTAFAGCYAPLYAPATPAASLPDSFRVPTRTLAMKRNLATLTAVRPQMKFGPGDVIDVTIPQLFPKEAQVFPPMRVQVTNKGMIHLPEAGAVSIGGATLSEAHARINRHYIDKGLLRNPTASISIVELATIDVLVLGEVKNPGVHRLVRGENDVAHALGAAGGLTIDAADTLELHRGNSQYASMVETAKLRQPAQAPSARTASRYPVRRTSHHGPSPFLSRLPPVDGAGVQQSRLKIERLPSTSAPEAFPSSQMGVKTQTRNVMFQPPSTFQRGQPAAGVGAGGGRQAAPAPGLNWRSGPAKVDGIPTVMKIPLTGYAIEPLPSELMALKLGRCGCRPTSHARCFLCCWSTQHDHSYTLRLGRSRTRDRFGLHHSPRSGHRCGYCRGYGWLH